MSGWRGTGMLLIAFLGLCGFIAPRSRAQTQNGLRVEYYVGSASYGAHPDRAKLFAPNNLRKVESAPNIRYSTDSVMPPVNGLPSNYFGIRWLGQILITETNDYVFIGTAHDGFRFWLSEKPIDPKVDAPLLNFWSSGKSMQNNPTPKIHLEAGARYYLLFEMYNNTDLGYAYLFWQNRPGLPTDQFYDLPTDQLYPEIPADQTPPDNISDLSVVSTSERSATVRWTATGDDSGNDAFYDLRYSFAPIDSSNFDQATPAIYTPSPASRGTSQTYVVTGLEPQRAYHFAMKAGDTAGNLSAVSNDAAGITQPFKILNIQNEGLLREVYLNLIFNNFARIDALRNDARYPGNPDQINYVTSFQTPSDIALDYGERVRGYLTPPLTGDYVFWIAADDCGELLLSSDDDPSHAREIAVAPDYTGLSEWTKYSEQKSAPIHLEAGKRYFIEAFHSQAAGASNLAVRWQLPNKKFESPIPESRLTPYPFPRTLGRISGFVTDTDGQPVPDARVYVTQGDYEFGGRTNASGYYTTATPIGLVKVTAYQPDSPYDGRASVIVAVSPGDANNANLVLIDYSASLAYQNLQIPPLVETSDDGRGSATVPFQDAWLASDANDNLYLAGSGNGICELNAEGDPIPILNDDRFLSSTKLFYPRGLALNRRGDLYIADNMHNRILKLDASTESISVVAGTGMSGYGGDEGPATGASLFHPYGIAADEAGDLFIADTNNHRIRKVDANGLITTVAGIGAAGYGGDGGLATLAKLNNPYDVAIDSQGNLYIADSFNNRVRRVDKNGIITTVAGFTSIIGGCNSGYSSMMCIQTPSGLAIDTLGNIYILSFWYVYKLKPDGFQEYVSYNDGNVSIEVNSLGDLYISKQSPILTKTLRAAGPGLLSPVSLSASNSSALPAGGTVQLAATDSRDPSAPPSAFKWSIDGLPGGSAEVGTIDANGLFTAPLNAGTYYLTAERDGAIGALKATVVEPDAPLLSLGSATLDPGASATLSISATAALSDVSGLDLILRAVGPDGAPPLTAVLERGADAKDWQVLPDPGDLWHLTIYSPSGAGLSGPAELMKLTVSADATAPHGASYAITARSLLATTSDGRWRTNRARVSSGSISIAKAAKGDMNGDGRIDMKDVTMLLRLALGLDPSSAEAIATGDANCDGRLTIVDATLLLQKAVGLSPSAWCEG